LAITAHLPLCEDSISEGEIAMKNIEFTNIAKLAEKRGDMEIYDWVVYPKVSPEQLKEIKEIEYVLHPTFPNPVRVKQDPKKMFAVTSRGWGEFSVGINVHLKSGETQRLSYELDLEKNWNQKIATQIMGKRVVRSKIG
jgi:transcription initiation factor IIF auxiliary subunit